MALITVPWKERTKGFTRAAKRASRLSLAWRLWSLVLDV